MTAHHRHAASLRTLLSVFIGGLVILLGTLGAQASELHIVTDSQGDFLAGTSDANLSLYASPGDIRLNQNRSTLTQTADQLAAGNQFGTKVGDTGSISLADRVSLEPFLTDTYINQVTAYGNYLYVATSEDGVFTIDTKGTAETTDDTLTAHYSTSSSPALPSNNTSSVQYNPDDQLLYIAFSGFHGGVAVIQTNGTPQTSDDSLFGSYTYDQFVLSGNYLYPLQLAYDHSHRMLYLATSLDGLSAIDTKGTTTLADDTVTHYFSGSTPALPGDSPDRVEISGNYLIVSTSDNGLFVYDTKGTASQADDVQAAHYDTGTTPAIPAFTATGLRVIGNYLYVSGSTPTVIDTKGTFSNQSDDAVATYDGSFMTTLSGSTARIYNAIPIGTTLLFVMADELIAVDTHGSFSTSDDIVSWRLPLKDAFWPPNPYSSVSIGTTAYFSTNFTLVSVDAAHATSTAGTFQSEPLPIASTPHDTVSWSQTVSLGQSAAVRSRYGIQPSADTNPFDGTTASAFVSTSYAFASVNQNNGTLKLSNPNFFTLAGLNLQLANLKLDTGKPSGYYPLGSKVSLKLRLNSSTAQLSPTIYTNVTLAGSGSVAYYPTLTNNEWHTLTFTNRGLPFSQMNLQLSFVNGTWSTGDSLEVDSLSIQPPTTWSDWSAYCQDFHGCAIPSAPAGSNVIQYEARLTSNGSASPTLSNVTLASGFAESGTYTSAILDGGSTATWKSLAVDGAQPARTAIIAQTRTGSTSTPDASWSAWENVDGSATHSPVNRYLQYRLTLSTTSASTTPTVSIVTATYEPYVAPTPVGIKKSPVATAVSAIPEPSPAISSTPTPEPIAEATPVPATDSPSPSPSPAVTLSKPAITSGETVTITGKAAPFAKVKIKIPEANVEVMAQADAQGNYSAELPKTIKGGTYAVVAYEVGDDGNEKELGSVQLSVKDAKPESSNTEQNQNTGRRNWIGIGGIVALLLAIGAVVQARLKRRA